MDDNAINDSANELAHRMWDCVRAYGGNGDDFMGLAMELAVEKAANLEERDDLAQQLKRLYDLGCEDTQDIIAELEAERDQLNAALAETAARCDTYRAERDRLRTLLAEVAASGVEFNDDRLNYVTIQVPRPVWVDIKALEE